MLIPIFTRLLVKLKTLMFSFPNLIPLLCQNAVFFRFKLVGCVMASDCFVYDRKFALVICSVILLFSPGL